MIKTFIPIIFALLSITTANAAESCQVLNKDVENGCRYAYDVNDLRVMSTDKLILDKFVCNIEEDKADWKDRPIRVYFPASKPDKTYTLIMIDPDAPDYKKGEYHLHWLVSNIPGNDFLMGRFYKGKSLTEYKGPQPPKNTGKHRYIFLAFEEEELNQNVTGSNSRVKFGLLPWIQRQPKRLCGPVAGVQFTAQYCSSMAFICD